MKRTRPAVGNSLVLGAATTRNVPKQWDPKLEILPHGWYLQWLENKDYVRTDILLNDKATMQALVRLARKASATPTEIQLCDDDEDIAENCAEVADDDAAESIADASDEPVNPAVESLTVAAESVTDDVLPVTAEAVSTTAEAVSAGEAAVPKPVPVVPVPVPVPVPTTVPAVPVSDARATVSQYAHSVASSSSTTEYERPNKNEQTYNAHATAHNANARVDDTDEHEELIRQLDLLRMRFKECKIPQNVEQGNASTVELRNTVQRNMLQLKRNRNIATYKLGMVGCLLVSELFFARFCRLDMSRFMKWHHSNMMTYEELLVEMGEVTTPLSNASPSTQLMMLLFFNTCLFLANELLCKWFNVDVLNVMGHITGATMNDTTQTSRHRQEQDKTTFEFAKDFM